MRGVFLQFGFGQRGGLLQISLNKAKDNKKQQTCPLARWSRPDLGICPGAVTHTTNHTTKNTKKSNYNALVFSFFVFFLWYDLWSFLCFFLWYDLCFFCAFFCGMICVFFGDFFCGMICVCFCAFFVV